MERRDGTSDEEALVRDHSGNNGVFSSWHPISHTLRCQEDVARARTNTVIVVASGRTAQTAPPYAGGSKLAQHQPAVSASTDRRSSRVNAFRRQVDDRGGPSLQFRVLVVAGNGGTAVDNERARFRVVCYSPPTLELAAGPNAHAALWRERRVFWTTQAGTSRTNSAQRPVQAGFTSSLDPASSSLSSHKGRAAALAASAKERSKPRRMRRRRWKWTKGG